MKFILYLFSLSTFVLTSCKNEFTPFNPKPLPNFYALNVNGFGSYNFLQTYYQNYVLNELEIINLSGSDLPFFETVIYVFSDSAKTNIGFQDHIKIEDLKSDSVYRIELNRVFDKNYKSIQIEILSMHIEDTIGGLYRGEYEIDNGSIKEFGLVSGVITYNRELKLRIDNSYSLQDSIVGHINTKKDFYGFYRGTPFSNADMADSIKQYLKHKEKSFLTIINSLNDTLKLKINKL